MDYVLADRVFPEILGWAGELTAIRRDIHMHPELGFQTENTAKRIAGLLSGWGIQDIDTERVRGGVIAVIEGSRPGPAVALRADIDALPMEDCSSNPWKSTIPGRAHACGHDGHQTWLLGAARYLNMKRDFPGKVVCLFQSAEEISCGAKAMVASGIIEEHGVREIYGAHDEPMLDKGIFGIHAGPLQASNDSFQIEIHGAGTHGGRPHHGIDPVPVGAQVILALQTIISRKRDPVEDGVLSICSVNAGRYETCNVIPHFLTMSGTVRTFSPELRLMIEERMGRMVKMIAEANECTAELHYHRDCGSVINDEKTTAAARAVAERLFGREHIGDMKPFMSSEDFSEYLSVVPGTMLRVGIRDEGHTVPVHSQFFDFNDEVLPAACTLLAAIAMNRLQTLATES